MRRKCADRRNRNNICSGSVCNESHLALKSAFELSKSLLLTAMLRAAGHGPVNLIVRLIRNGNVVLTEGGLNLGNEHVSFLLHHVVVAEVADGVQKVGVLVLLDLIKDGQVLGGVIEGLATNLPHVVQFSFLALVSTLLT